MSTSFTRLALDLGDKDAGVKSIRTDRSYNPVFPNLFWAITHELHLRGEKEAAKWDQQRNIFYIINVLCILYLIKSINSMYISGGLEPIHSSLVIFNVDNASRYDQINIRVPL